MNDKELADEKLIKQQADEMDRLRGIIKQLHQDRDEWKAKAGRLQEENKTLRQCLNDYAPFGVDSE